MKGGTLQIAWHDSRPILTLDFHRLTGLLATGGADCDIKFWSLHSIEDKKEPVKAVYKNSLSHHSATVNVIRFSPSGERLASGADGGELLIWKLHKTENGDSWKVLKTLCFHRKDVLDLHWSPDGAFLISGSVDNTCIIWDATTGIVQQTLDSHLHYVQGVCWDPIGQYVASISSDRTCKIYTNKPPRPGKGRPTEKICFANPHVISKSEVQIRENDQSAKYHLFHDETLPSFFRRLQWSPDGSFLIAPAGIHKFSASSPVSNTAYVFSRRDLSRPALHLPGASKPVVAVRFCPVLFKRNAETQDGPFKLPYRIVFALATLNSLYIYDTESATPIGIYAGLHYASVTDIAWSSDAKFLAVSSQDCYCTIVEFEDGDLGTPALLSEIPTHVANLLSQSAPNTGPSTEENMDIDISHSQVYQPEPLLSNAHTSHTTTSDFQDINQESKVKQVKDEDALPIDILTKTQKVQAQVVKTPKKRITPVAL